MTTATLPSLSERVVRDHAGTPLQCQVCVTRLATTLRSVLRVCDDCNADIERRIALAGYCEPWMSIPEAIAKRHELKQSIPDIAKDLEIPVREVMEALGEDWYCQSCGEGRDLHAEGVSGEFCTGGDETRAGWLTKCCFGWFIGRSGSEYIGPNPAMEASDG